MASLFTVTVLRFTPTKMVAQSSGLPSVQSIFREWNSETKPRKPFPLLSLPPELLCIINDYLQPLDKVCFAFTSKSLWKFLQPRLPRSALRGLSEHSLDDVSRITSSQRWKLLGRLETNSWKRCAGCVYLHLRSQFDVNDIDNKAEKRFCKTPGLIQLCPHYNLTQHKAWKLQQKLSDLTLDDNTIIDGKITQYFEVHECDLSKNSVTASVSLEPFLDRGTLTYRNTFTVQGFEMDKLSNSLRTFGRKIFQICPHKAFRRYATAMMDDATNPCDLDCKDCGMQLLQHKTEGVSGGKGLLCFTTNRPVIGPLQGERRDCGWDSQAIAYLEAWLSRSNLANRLSLDVDQADEWGDCLDCGRIECANVTIIH